MTLKAKIYSIRRHPSIMVDILKAKNWEYIEDKSRKLDEKEVFEFTSYLKRTLAYHMKNPNDQSKLNRLCYVEDWENSEIKEALTELQKLSSEGFIHRKDWEWALGIIAMRRFGKLNEKSTAIGVGAGTEPVPFYLANKVKHVYATDLYGQNEGWKRAAPSDFPENPKKYAPFPYKEDALTVLRMDGTKLEFPSESFDTAFSFSSIEHFGDSGDGKNNHSGALRSLKEMERVLKPGGLAVITTEYIINDKEHPEFFNRRTIYSDLIDKLERLKLVEPLDLRITTKTLDTVIDFFTIDLNWDKMDSDYKKTHPVILIRARNILFTSIMLVFRKQ
jgi:SAM-dependent methyltransferase